MGKYEVPFKRQIALFLMLTLFVVVACQGDDEDSKKEEDDPISHEPDDNSGFNAEFYSKLRAECHENAAKIYWHSENDYV